MDFSMKDTYRNYVETVSGGKNTVIYDQHGNPNIMVIINRFTNDYLGLGTGTHPAFIVGDKEVDEIFIGKYKACIGNGGAGASVPGVEIAGNMTLQSSREATAKAGDGFHLITNAEIAAVALLGWKNGYTFNYNEPEKEGLMVGVTGNIMVERVTPTIYVLMMVHNLEFPTWVPLVVGNGAMA